MLVLALTCGSGSAAAQASLPRMADGLPDLQGTWTLRTLTPFFRPEGVAEPSLDAIEAKAFLATVMAQRLAAERLDPGTSDPDGEALAMVDGRLRTSAVVSPATGRLALTQAGIARLNARPSEIDGPESRPVNERCIADAGRAPYRVMSGEMFFEIVQTPDFLVIRKEGMDPPRIFATAGAARSVQANTWSGISRGGWRDDAFVVETTGFRADDASRRISGPGAAGFPIAPQTLVTEWFIPVSADVILYRFRVEDRDLYSEPLVAELPMVRTSLRLFEAACHEGNFSLENTLRAGLRAEELKGGPRPPARQ